MRYLRTALAVVLATGANGFVMADETLLQKNNCFACHSIDKRKYGPKLNEVAAKYAKQAKAADLLAKKIRRGGTGVWGRDVMPPQPQVSKSDAKTLAKYILALEPASTQ
jgi:cytochrome c